MPLNPEHLHSNWGLPLVWAGAGRVQICANLACLGPQAEPECCQASGLLGPQWHQASGLPEPWALPNGALAGDAPVQREHRVSLLGSTTSGFSCCTSTFPYQINNDFSDEVVDCLKKAMLNTFFLLLIYLF